MRSVIKSHGFTLIEMIVSMIILGIISIGLINFGVLGGQTYVDVRNRDEMLNQARFALERINRDVRHAVPMSLREESNGACIEFVPIVFSSEFNSTDISLGANELPFSRELHAEEITIIQEACTNTTCYMTIYPLSPDDIYLPNLTDRTFTYSSVTTSELVLQELINSSISTVTNRFYIYSSEAISYCFDSSNRLLRGRFDISNPTSPIVNVPVASYISSTESSFEYDPTGYRQNGLLEIQLTVEKRGESLEFYHNAHVFNGQ